MSTRKFENYDSWISEKAPTVSTIVEENFENYDILISENALTVSIIVEEKYMMKISWLSWLSEPKENIMRISGWSCISEN